MEDQNARGKEPETTPDLLRAINAEERHLNHGLDYLAGCWSLEEAETIDAELDRLRPIDAELWKRSASW
jgi:hypothetical protein